LEILFLGSSPRLPTIYTKCIMKNEQEDPMCEECDVLMYPFAHDTGDRYISGWACASCGWSFDEINEPHASQEINKPKYKEKQYNIDTIELQFVKSVTDVDIV